MGKRIRDMAEYLLNLLPPEIPEKFEIDSMFCHISSVESMRKGVRAFKDFLSLFYSSLIANGDLFDKPKKEAHPFADGTNITTSYPFVCNCAVIILNIGFRGNLSKDGTSIMLDDLQLLTAENNISNAKIPNAKIIECLRFLMGCGIQIGNVDLNDKKLDLSTLGFLEILYPKNPAMLTGLKVMATAQQKLITSTIQDVLLRCDYRIMTNKEMELFSVLNDLVQPLPADVRKFILTLHQNYMRYGYKCEYSTTSFYIRFTYFCRSKELWRLNLSLNNGFNIGIKAINTAEYSETIEKFPEWLQEKITKGYGCGKKRGITNCCDGGCRGFRISLYDSFMETSNIIETWINAEVSCVQK